MVHLRGLKREDMVDPDIAALKHRLIQEWDHHPLGTLAASDPGLPRAQGLRDRRPRVGLAIGHAHDRSKGKTRLEMRVTAESGPNFTHARSLVATAEQQGIEASLRFFHRPTVVPLAEAQSTKPSAAPSMGVRTARCRPPYVGLSVGHERGSAGSIGAFVRTPEGHQGILSCTHVLARASKGRVEIDDWVHQPAPLDQPMLLPGNRIGRLTQHFALLTPTRVNNIDAAVARIIDTDKHTGPLENALPDHPDVPAKYRRVPFGPLLTPDDIDFGTPVRVMKFGRSSGFTDNAVVSGVEFENFAVWFDTNDSFTFSSVIELQWDGGHPFTLDGDSGALILAQDGLRPIGLHFAASDLDRLSWAIPLKRICDTFELALI
jgi:hypothetical protein